MLQRLQNTMAGKTSHQKEPTTLWARIPRSMTRLPNAWWDIFLSPKYGNLHAVVEVWLFWSTRTGVCAITRVRLYYCSLSGIIWYGSKAELIIKVIIVIQYSPPCFYCQPFVSRRGPLFSYCIDCRIYNFSSHRHAQICGTFEMLYGNVLLIGYQKYHRS